MANTVFTTTTNVTLSGGGLTATASAANAIALAGAYRDSGKYAVEFTVGTNAAASYGVGLAPVGVVYSASTGAGGLWAIFVAKSGAVYIGTTTSAGSVGALVPGDKVSIEVDATRKIASARRNGGAAVSGTFTQAFVTPAWQSGSSGDSVTLNSGDTAFTYAPSAGYTAGWPAPGDPTALIATQLGAEAFVAAPSELWVTQLGVEVWRSTGDTHAASLLVTQLGVQVWVSVANAPPPSAARRRRPVLVSSFGPAS